MPTILSVALPNRPGSLAAVLDAVAQAGVNIHAIDADALGDFGSVHLLTADPTRTADLLRKSGYDVVEGEAIELQVAHQAGSLAQLARKLADAKVNIVAAFGTAPIGGGAARILVRTNDNAAAKKALGLR